MCRPDEEYILYPGSYGYVCHAEVEDGIYPTVEFFEELGPQAQASLMALFERVTSNPQLQLKNRTKFKQYDGDLFSFKCNQHQLRLFCFRHRKSWRTVHGITDKKEDKTPPAEVRRAKQAMNKAKALINKGSNTNKQRAQKR